MDRVTCRRPNLGDLMILIVAAAVGATWLRELLKTTRFVSWSSPFAKWADLTVLWVPPVLVPVTAAALIMRLRPPRPPLRRMFQQPGAIATALVALNAFVLGPMVLLRLAVVGPAAFGRPPCPALELDHLGARFVENGRLIGASWLVLGFSGRFRPERGWIDGLGRLVGLAWIAFWVVVQLGHWLLW